MLSQHPEAVRSRKRRQQHRAAAATGKPAAVTWLEMIRELVAEEFAVDLVTTYAGGGSADLEGEAALTAQRTAWLAVGRYTPEEPVTYADLGRALSSVSDDLLLEATIHPQRLSQIRVEFADPNLRRRDDTTVLSKIGPWQFVVSDLVGELVGADPDDPTDGSLAARYKATVVPRFYVFFAEQIVGISTKIPWMGPAKK